VAGLSCTPDEYANHDACWLLIATLVCCGVVLPLQVVYIVQGTGSAIYLAIVALLALGNVLALRLCQCDPQRAALLFSWVMFAAIVGMLVIDAADAADTFPGITNLLAIVAMGTAYIVGLRRAALHIAADVLALVWLASLYGLSDTVPILAACTIGGALVGRLRDELHRNRRRADSTEAAIHTYVIEKRNGYKSNGGS
jgi:small-conductance mechanosensitive channel